MNLRSAQYVRVLCGSLAHLSAAFAAVDARPAIELAAPTREQRYKMLRQRLQLLLAHAEAGTLPAAEPTGKRPTPAVQPVDPHKDRPELAGLGDEELQALRDGVFPSVAVKPRKPRDPRLPPPGVKLTRRFRGRGHQVVVTEEGFHYRGKDYTGLTTIATEISGSLSSGYVFFRLTKPWTEGGAEAAATMRQRDKIQRERERYRRKRVAATES